MSCLGTYTVIFVVTGTSGASSGGNSTSSPTPFDYSF
jgi:hypothetical protein